MTFNPDIHHRRSIRFRDYDYSNAGAYFVTICTFQRECLFGEVQGGNFVSNEAGEIVTDIWMDLTKRFSSLSLDEFVVMPNHFHGILLFADAFGSCATSKPGAASGAPTLGTVLRAFKSLSAIAVNKTIGRQGVSLWQRNYYERVIRDEQELDVLRQYVAANPSQGEKDENHPSL